MFSFRPLPLLSFRLLPFYFYTPYTREINGTHIPNRITFSEKSWKVKSLHFCSLDAQQCQSVLLRFEGETRSFPGTKGRVLLSQTKRSSMVARGRHCDYFSGPWRRHRGPDTGSDVGSMCSIIYIYILYIHILTHAPPSPPLLTFRARHSSGCGRLHASPSKQTLRVRVFLKVYGAWLLFFVSARTNKRHHHL